MDLIKPIKIYRKKQELNLNKFVRKLIHDYPEFLLNRYPPELIDIFEIFIACKADSLCMDNKSERKKIAKLVYNFLNNIF